jgi:hypothetical protein
MDDKPFVGVELRKIDAMDEMTRKVIDLLTSRILIAATIADGILIDPNFSFAAMQKALSLLIAKFFKEDQVDDIADSVNVTVAYNASLWKGS